jgi:L-threonylcarbamoyladenylate synthase
LGADAANADAVGKIFAAKGRPADHPLIVHLAGHDAVDAWAEDVPPIAWELMETFWPGPLTLILKKQAWVPSTVTGGQDTVGLRVPGHPVALELLRRFAAAKAEKAEMQPASPRHRPTVSAASARPAPRMSRKNWASAFR